MQVLFPIRYRQMLPIVLANVEGIANRHVYYNKHIAVVADARLTRRVEIN